MQHRLPFKTLFEGQLFHLGALIGLLFLLWYLSALSGANTGVFLGISTMGWAGLIIANAVTHQVYVWFCWRSELHAQFLTILWGEKGFRNFAIGFTALLVLRPILAFAIGWANRGTLAIDPVFAYSATIPLIGLTAYLMYCVRAYFSFQRAFGIDHFEARYRKSSLVRRGIFRVSPNAMYVFGFLGLWVPAFLFQSLAALLLAAFSHAYIWVHYIATERPDMEWIYGNNKG